VSGPLRWRPASREERALAWLWAASAAAALLLRRFWLAVAAYLPPCAFRQLTGVPCPTCGTTHAAVALLEGRPLAAFAANPLAALAALVLLGGGFAAPLWLAVRGEVPVIPTPLPRWLRSAALLALAASWLWVIWRWA